MQGTAEATRINDQKTNAQEIIFGEKIMSQILVDAGWLKDNPTELEQARIKESIENNISIEGGKGLIKISYQDSDPMRAHITNISIEKLFIEEGKKTKINTRKA